ncbi:MAG: hypothetical protein ACRC0X_07305, partial [Brevinema sp.]
IGARPQIGSLVLLNFLNGDLNFSIISAIINAKDSPDFQDLPENKLAIRSNGKDLGEILLEMCRMVTSLKTVGSPTTQTLDPSQILEWQLFMENEIKEMFAPLSNSVGDGNSIDLENTENKKYINTKFNSFQLDNLKKGMYFLTQEDVSAIQKSSEIFWQYIANNLPISQVLSIREAAGKNKDEVYNKTVGDKIFIPSHIGLESIKIIYSKHSSPKENIYDDGKRKVQVIGLFANFLGANLHSLTITSTSRTPEEQADIMVKKIINFPNGKNYPTVRDRIKKYYLEYQQNKVSEKEYKDYIYIESLKHIEESPSGYRHINKNHKYVFDIGVFESNNYLGMSSIDITKMTQSFQLFESRSFISPKSLYYEETKDEQAYHFVID